MTATAAKSTVTDRRLIVGPIPDDFDPLRDIVGGWWCLAGVEQDHPDCDKLDILEPIKNPDDVVIELKAINALVNDLIIEWTPRWNAKHNVEYSSKFWHVLSVAWLVDLVHLVRYRYLEIKQILDKCQGQHLVAKIIPPSQRFTFNGYADFAPASYADQKLSCWISSLVLNELSPSNVDLQIDPEAHASTFVANAYAPPPSSGAWNVLRTFKAALKPDRCRIGSGAREFTPWLKASTLFAELVLASICRISSSGETLSYSAPEPSNGKFSAHFSKDFINILNKAMDGTMLRSLAQDFGELNSAAKDFRYTVGSKRLETSFFHLDNKRQFKIAHAVESGEILIGVQHGGNAGTAAAIQLAPETEYRSHAAVTWGWTSCGGYPGNFIPLPSPQLAPWIGKHNPTEDTIVVVGTGVRFIPGRFSFEGDIFNRSTSRAEKSSLFNTLSDDVRLRTRYRPYFGMQNTLADALYFETRHPDIPQIKDAFFDRLMHCNLMVIDHPGTTMLQALAAGIPFIGFWTPAAFHMCPEAKEHFDRLREAKVIFDNGADAARHVNDVANDIQGWWSQPDVQSAIRDVRDTYAKTSKTWLIDWAKALIRL